MAVLEASVSPRAPETMKNQSKNDKKKVLVVAQELKLARVLAGNNKTSRDRALKSLKKWFQNRSSTIPFTEEDFLRLWKGLFYSMWMSDKPLVQEECAENISNLLHSLPFESAVVFYKCGMVTLMNEWFGIDQLRLDKFLMFVRRLLRQALFAVKNQQWSRKTALQFTGCLSETILDPKKQKPMGLLMHFIEIYLEELAKVSEGELPPHLTTDLLVPFIKQLAFSNDPRVIDHVRKHVFVHLIRQSDLGLEYSEKYEAWRTLGFPGSIDSMKKVPISDESEGDESEGEEATNEKVYDPRAGRVDVYLPQIRFHCKALVKALCEYKFDKLTNSKSRKCLKELAEHFKKLGSGIYPLGIKKVTLVSDDYDTNIRKAVNRLVKFEQKIQGKSKKRKLQNENVVELRGGKKIKLDGGLVDQLQSQLVRSVRKKRKAQIAPDAPLNKVEKLEIETMFKRNSGTWMVTKMDAVDVPKIFTPSNTKEEKSESPPTMRSMLKSGLFDKPLWGTTPDTSIEKSLKKARLSLPANLLKNPFANSTPTKKVQINTKLNRSQEVDEHHAQILSSPAIPYDANKKPSKPLLKRSARKSPINPFYF